MTESREDIAKTLFLSTWERYDKAVGRLGLALIAALLIHLQVAQYLELDRGIRLAKAEEMRLSKQLAAVSALGTELTRLREYLRGAVKSVLTGFAPSLRKQFLSLDEQFPRFVSDAVRKQLPPRRVAAGASTRGENDNELDLQGGANPLTVQSNIPNIMTQPAPFTQSQPSAVFSLSELGKSEIGSASDQDELIGVLHKIAEREIVEPVFEELNQKWSRDHRPEAIKQTKELLQDLSITKEKLPDEGATW
ncbi:MAG: hypothetical protein AABZ47_15215, partial [Planctomycetota bacterium]